ncbi:hypothetical protein E2562_020608, partial [Oryza meyeriana var. granulata]
SLRSRAEVALHIIRAEVFLEIIQQRDQQGKKMEDEYIKNRKKNSISRKEPVTKESFIKFMDEYHKKMEDDIKKRKKYPEPIKEMKIMSAPNLQIKEEGWRK